MIVIERIVCPLNSPTLTCMGGGGGGSINQEKIHTLETFLVETNLTLKSQGRALRKKGGEIVFTYQSNSLIMLSFPWSFFKRSISLT